MSTGAWQVRVQVDGERGPGTLAVPVPAAATRILPIQKGLGATLAVLGLVLFFGLVSIIGAGTREAQLAPGKDPDLRRVRVSRITMAATGLLLLGVLWLGNQWWNSEAGGYQTRIFKPLQFKTAIEGSNLRLELQDPGWLNRKTDDLIPDHNHLMHLYVIRIPEMDQVWHLHPQRSGDSVFSQSLPAMPGGRYALYGDIVHETGFPETVTAEVDFPQIAGRPLEGDDAGGNGPPLGKATSLTFTLPDGYRMVWERESAPYHSRQPYEFRFRLEDPEGHPAQDMELYMGMQGHAAFVRSDRSVFAHVHPSGSVPMASLGLVMPADPHAGHMMMHEGVPAVVAFPYGFPKPGDYRIFVQVKRAGKVETGIFDARVEN